MNVVLLGNYLGSKQGKTKNGDYYHIVSILSGDSAVRVSFDDDSISVFEDITDKDRLQEVSVQCDLNIYNGNAYFHALPY